MLTSIIFFCVVFTLVSEFATHVTYGRIMKDQEVLDYLKSYESYSLNQFDHSIISGDIDYSSNEEVIKKIMRGDFIAHTRMSVLSKYYIQGYGRVSSWSKGAKAIDNLYKTSLIK